MHESPFHFHSLDHLDQVHPEGAVERAVDDHVGRRVHDEQDVAEEAEEEENGRSKKIVAQI